LLLIWYYHSPNLTQRCSPNLHGDRLQEVEFSHPGLPPGKVLARASTRSQNYISQVDPNHTLLPIALDYLKDKDAECPAAHQLYEGVASKSEKNAQIRMDC
jgi:hypothetical protein